MTETQLQLERLRTLQESYNDLDDKINVVLPALADKIDNIQLPEINTTELAKESTLQEESATIQSKIDNIDLTPIENKVDEGVSTLSTKINNIDLSSVAKQGENTGATNTAILAEIKAINDLKNIYSVRFEQNQDGDNTYTMVLPLVAGIVGDTIIM